MPRRIRKPKPTLAASPPPLKAPSATPKQAKPRPKSVQAQFITIAEAAARLGISVKTVRRWIDTGKLGAVRMGSQIRIPVAALLHFISILPPAGASTKP